MIRLEDIGAAAVQFWYHLNRSLDADKTIQSQERLYELLEVYAQQQEHIMQELTNLTEEMGGYGQE